MAHLYRLIVAIVLGMLCSIAAASISTGPSYKARWNTTWTGSYATANAACVAAMGLFNAGDSAGRTLTDAYGSASSSSESTCVATLNGKLYAFGTWHYYGLVCPSNSTASGTSCTCNSGYKESASTNSCIADNLLTWTEVELRCSTVGLAVDSYIVGKSVSKTCAAVSGSMGCNVELVGDTVAYEVDGEWRTHGKLIKTGTACVVEGETQQDYEEVPADTPTSVSSETGTNTCKNGYEGTVNGTTVCLPASSASETVSTSDKTETGTNDSGEQVEKKTSNKTECKDGQCTTTTTVTTTNKTTSTTTTSTSSTTQSKSSYCTGSNASKPECIGENSTSSFSGGCSSGFQASGDAIQSAMVKEQYKRNCEMFETDSDERQAYLAAKALEGDQTGDLEGNTESSFSAGDIDTSDALGGGACIPDITISVLGRSITLPLSQLCEALYYMGVLLQAVAFLLGARIFIRG